MILKRRFTMLIRAHSNIDRLLTASQTSDAQALGSETYGTLVCEVIALRELAAKTLSKATYRDFVSDIDGLIGVENTLPQRIRVADRIRWVYSTQL